MKVKVAVTAVSGKKEKEQGWVRFTPINGKWVWEDFGAHFNLNLLTKFVAPGLYELDLENSALGFGERPKYQVEAVKFLERSRSWRLIHKLSKIKIA